MNSTSKCLLVFTGLFLLLGSVALHAGHGPSILQSFGSAAACLWGVWLFRDKAGK